MTLSIEEALRKRAAEAEHALVTALGGKNPQDASHPALARLREAQRHAALLGGKRLRPFLCVEACAAVGGAPARAVPAGCAVEMIHAYSLVHDDLPAMDDAETRRGRPSVHVAYGEATAILAGDGLLTDAFGVLADAYDGETARALVRLLAAGAGSEGMVGGQAMDLEPEGAGEAEVAAIQARKTGALIRAAALMGGAVGGADETQRAALGAYADALGLAFQVQDDVLDATAEAGALGKPAGRDEAAGKATYVGLLGLEGARARVADLTEAAAAAAGRLPSGDTLAALARWQAKRTS